MAYTLVIVKDSRELRDARVAREKAKLELAKNPEVLEELNPVTDLHDENDNGDNEHTAKEKKTGLKALFDLSNIKDGLRAVLRERPHHKRAFLLLMILIFEIEIFLIVRKQPRILDTY